MELDGCIILAGVIEELPAKIVRARQPQAVFAEQALGALYRRDKSARQGEPLMVLLWRIGPQPNLHLLEQQIHPAPALHQRLWQSVKECGRPLIASPGLGVGPKERGVIAGLLIKRNRPPGLPAAVQGIHERQLEGEPHDDHEHRHPGRRGLPTGP